MLPECRTYGEHYPIPKSSTEKRDVQEFRQELSVNIKVMMGDDVSEPHWPEGSRLWIMPPPA